MTDDDHYSCEDCGLRSCVCFDERDAIWCDRCQGTGSVDCYCGGDFCVCANGGERDCPRCGGEGEFVPKPGQLEREAKAHAELRAVLSAALFKDGGERG